jgi:hypothetical protein
MQLLFVDLGRVGSQLQRDDSTLETKMGKTVTKTNKRTRYALNILQCIYKNGRSLIIYTASREGNPPLQF